RRLGGRAWGDVRGACRRGQGGEVLQAALLDLQADREHLRCARRGVGRGGREITGRRSGRTRGWAGEHDHLRWPRGLPGTSKPQVGRGEKDACRYDRNDGRLHWYPPDADKGTALSGSPCANQTSGTKLDALPPVIECVCQHLVEGNLWLPAGRCSEPARVGDQDLDVGRPHLLRYLPDLDRGLRHRQHAVEDLPDAGCVAGADVVDLPRLPLLEGQP